MPSSKHYRCRHDLVKSHDLHRLLNEVYPLAVEEVVTAYQTATTFS
jgi:hypothetical protein